MVAKVQDNWRIKVINPLEKFKHRNIAKVATAYAVVGWLMLQMTEIILPTFNAPQWIAQTIIFVVIMGFPIALLIAWASEMKSDVNDHASGESTLESSAIKASVGQVPKRLFYSVGAISVSVIGLFAFYVSTSLFDVNSPNEESSRTTGGAQIETAQNFRGPRFSLNLGATGYRPLHNTTTDLALSNNGRLLAFLDHGETTSEIFIKDLLFPDSTRSLGTIGWVQGSGQMFFSEDGEWLHFIDNGQLKRIRVEGGQFQTLNEAITVVRSGFSSFDDNLIYSNIGDGKLYKQILSTGETSKIEVNEDGGRFYSWPRILPDYAHLLVTSSDNATSVGDGNIQVIGLESGVAKTLIRTASNAQYVNSGHIVFIRDAALWAVPFDLESLTLSGAQVPVIQGIETNSQYGHATFSVSELGRLTYLPGKDGGELGEELELKWISKDGEVTGSNLTTASYGHIELSPTENRAAFTIYTGDGSSDVWVWDLGRGTLGRRTFDGKASRSIWSANGDTLYYRHLDLGLRAVAANGTEQPITLFETDSPLWPQTISPDGSAIIFNTGQPYATYRLTLDDEIAGSKELSAEVVDLTPVVPLFLSAEISPTGDFISYCSNESGLNQIYVRPWPEIERGKWQASISGGCGATWDSSKELLYYQLSGAMYEVPYSLGEYNDQGKPTLIEFDIPTELEAMGRRNFVYSPNTWDPYDYSKDRDQFIVVGRIGSALEGLEEELLSAQTTLVVVENWFDELLSLAPSARSL